MWHPSVKVADSPCVRDVLRKKALTGCKTNGKHLCRPFSKVKECANKLKPAAAVHLIQLVFGGEKIHAAVGKLRAVGEDRLLCLLTARGHVPWGA